MRERVIVCLVIFLLIGQIGVVTEITISGSEGNIDTTPSSVSITNFIEDPYFTTEPETIVEGTSVEFSSNYHQAIDEDDFNYMELTWDHTANTSLDFRIGEDEDLPDCFDFIYLYQEFDWPFNEMPLDAELQINFTTTLTGSFASEESGQIMFRVYAWMIDSSGNWQQVLKTYPLYSDIYQERRAVFSHFDLVETWEGMIENSTGFQEDPEDIVRVAVGLAPTHGFETHFAYEDDPWEFYEGSVSVRIKSMELWVYMQEDPDPSQVLSPLYNSTWKYSVRDVFPDIPEEFENSSRVEFREIATDTDDSVYILCNSYASYELYMNQSKTFSYQFLQKYSAKLELDWSVRNDNGTTAHGLTIHDGFIYTTGYIRTDDETESRNLIVTKWSPNGEKLWQTEWGGIYDEEGTGIAVSSDGSIFVWATYWNRRFEPEFWKSSFLKFDSSGTLLWNKTNELLLFPGCSELEMQPDGMYSWDSMHVEKRDLNCEPTWNISVPARAVNFDDSGNIYLASYGYGSGEHLDEWQVMISKWNSDGAELWHSNYSVPLEDGSSWIFQCRAVDVAPDGSVLAILHGWKLIYDYHMVKFNPDGNLIWVKIIGDEQWPVRGDRDPKLEISDNGLAYVGFNRMGDYGVEVAVSAFVVGPYPLGPEFPTTMIIVGMSVAALVVVAAVVYIRKYRTA